MTTSYDIGINMNDNAAATVDKVVPILKNLGVDTVRIWAGVDDFTDRTMVSGMKRALDYAAAGFDVTLVVANDDGKVTNASEVTAWFKWAMTDSSLKAAVDRWEIGNEPDSYKYWQGTLSTYVSDFLKPAYQVLHAAGETVISGAPSWDPNDVKTMIGYGMLDYCDYVGFHPYATGVSGVVKSINAINEVVAGRKPIAATEWNVRGLESNKTAWGQAVEDAYPYIKDGFALNYYFAMKVQDSMAGPAGILTNAFAYNQPFYNAFATFSGATDSDGTGSTPGSVSGSITGTLFNDTDGDGTWDSGESATGSRVVYIDANRNGKLDSGEKQATANSSGVYTFTGLAAGTYYVTRVFPSGYHLSNNSSGYVTTTVSAGKTTTGVNLGTVADSVTPPTTGTTTGSITGTLWNDTDGDGTWDSGEAVTGSRVVFIDANGNGKLDSGEKSTSSNSSGVYVFSGLAVGSYKVSRVFPTGYTLSNNSDGYVAATVSSGKTTTGVNLGTVSTSSSGGGSTGGGTTTPTTPSTNLAEVKAIALVNTKTGATIASNSYITASKTVDLSALPTTSLAVIAVADGDTKSVKLTTAGKTVIESSSPYSYFGDVDGVYTAWKPTEGSSYTFGATAYSGTNATGTVGTSISITLKFT
ncbi:MAG: SdrD B-like domain-containing protein [Tepidisphaeraceae bacterium]